MTQTLRIDARPRSGDGSERRLRLVLRANAATSLTSGVIMAAVPGAIDELLGTGHPGWVRLVGSALVPFALFVAWLSTSGHPRLRALTPGIIVGDLAWVAASIVTVLLGWYSTDGVLAVGAMALAVDVFAGLQWWSWRRLGSTDTIENPDFGP